MTEIMFGPLRETDFYEKGKGNWSRIEYIGEEENKFTSIYMAIFRIDRYMDG